MPSERHRLAVHYGGWRHSLPHTRRPLADTSGIQILEEVDPRADFKAAGLEIWDQLQLGSCTGNATEPCFRYDSILDGIPILPLSRLDIYWQERKREGTIGQGDTGAVGSDAFAAAAEVGICAEADWPYDPARYNQESYFDPATPPAAAVADSKYYVLKKPVAAVPPTVDDMKRALSNRQQIAFGFSVSESFEAPWAQQGIMPLPKPGEQVLGGHEVRAVGYLKDEPNYALVANSWGTGWGDDGYFLMPWSFLTDANQAADWRTIQRPIGK